MTSLDLLPDYGGGNYNEPFEIRNAKIMHNTIAKFVREGNLEMLKFMVAKFGIRLNSSMINTDIENYPHGSTVYYSDEIIEKYKKMNAYITEILFSQNSQNNSETLYGFGRIKKRRSCKKKKVHKKRKPKRKSKNIKFHE